mmetsp:Transcript_12458/g.25310  ORF Transcript_12458/g.25310 Transcript_12458/m.25310 type:complete len:203 (-) Transcript_12458:227-835(-)
MPTVSVSPQQRAAAPFSGTPPWAFRPHPARRPSTPQGATRGARRTPSRSRPAFTFAPRLRSAAESRYRGAPLPPRVAAPRRGNRGLGRRRLRLRQGLPPRARHRPERLAQLELERGLLARQLHLTPLTLHDLRPLARQLALHLRHLRLQRAQLRDQRLLLLPQRRLLLRGCLYLQQVELELAAERGTQCELLQASQLGERLE